MPPRNDLSRRLAVPLENVRPITISAEAVTIAAGAAGTVKDSYILNRPIADANGESIGGFGNSSLSFASGVFDVEVNPGTADASLANGEYWIDYLTGHIHGKKKTTGTSESATYKIFVQDL